jgi:methylglutaconyl-CoA hydratase
LAAHASSDGLACLGRILDGQQAFDIRLVNEVVKQNLEGNSAYKRSLEVAREIAQQVRSNLNTARSTIQFAN